MASPDSGMQTTTMEEQNMSRFQTLGSLVGWTLIETYEGGRGLGGHSSVGQIVRCEYGDNSITIEWRERGSGESQTMVFLSSGWENYIIEGVGFLRRLSVNPRAGDNIPNPDAIQYTIVRLATTARVSGILGRGIVQDPKRGKLYLIEVDRPDECVEIGEDEVEGWLLGGPDLATFDVDEYPYFGAHARLRQAVDHATKALGD